MCIFPWQEKLVAPLIATPNVAMQFEDKVTEKGRERSYATGYRSDSVAYRDIRFFLQQIGQSPNTNYAMQNEFKEGK